MQYPMSIRLALLAAGTLLALNLPLLAQPKGNCLLLSGQGDYVKIDSSASLNPGAALTLAGWTLLVAAVDWPAFIMKGGADDNYSDQWNTEGYALQQVGVYASKQPGQIDLKMAVVRDSAINAQQGSCVTPALPVGQWKHVAAVYDGSTVKGYVDGVLQTTCNGYSGSVIANASNIYFGVDWPGTAEFWTGYIDEIMIWHRALSAAEIAKIKTCDTTGATDSMIGYWSFDEGQGSKVYNLAPRTYGSYNGSVNKFSGTFGSPAVAPVWRGINPANINVPTTPKLDLVSVAGNGPSARVPTTLIGNGASLEFFSPSTPQVLILTPQGRQVATLRVVETNRNTYQASLQQLALPRGMYFASVRTAAGEIARAPLMR